jgi:hypothetical protein
MRTLALAVASLGIALVPALNATPASAGIDHTYVMQSGSGTACTYAAPCAVVQTAINATNPGGDVYILDGDYKENIIIGPSQGNISISGNLINNGVIIRATTTDGSNDTITINAASNANVAISNVSVYPDRNGIVFNCGRQLKISNGTSANGAANIGLLFQPTCPATGGDGITRLQMNDVSFNGHTGGVLIKPSGGVFLEALIIDLRTYNQPYGVTVDNTGGSGTMAINIQQSKCYHSATDCYHVDGSGAGVVVVTLDGDTMAENGNSGALATGANANMLVTGSTLTANVTGIVQALGASVSTFTDNAMLFNGANFAGTVHHLAKH